MSQPFIVKPNIQMRILDFIKSLFKPKKVGRFTPVDASRWVFESEHGVSYAQFNIGVCYAYGILGFPVNKSRAVEWYYDAAEGEDSPAQYALGVCYESGEGVRVDNATALHWYRLAAENGNAKAQNALGRFYAEGKVVPIDEAEAIKWWRKSAEQGNASAQCNLGLIYYKGIGVQMNYDEAASWFRKSAEQGYEQAQCLLGVCLYNGEGVPVQLVEAYAFFSLSAVTRQNARDYLSIIEKKMTSAQIKAGKKRSKELQKEIEANIAFQPTLLRMNSSE